MDKGGRGVGFRFRSPRLAVGLRRRIKGGADRLGVFAGMTFRIDATRGSHDVSTSQMMKPSTIAAEVVRAGVSKTR